MHRPPPVDRNTYDLFDTQSWDDEKTEIASRTMRSLVEFEDDPRLARESIEVRIDRRPVTLRPVTRVAVPHLPQRPRPENRTSPSYAWAGGFALAVIALGLVAVFFT
jgi:hypothetical protein